MTQLEIKLPTHTYPIYIGSGALENKKNELLTYCPGKRAVVVSDETVWALHHQKFTKILQGLSISFTPIIVPPGETSKSIAVLELLYQKFAQFHLTRQAPIIAFGGGVVGDLAGFAASTFMRGVPFIQIPTTLLAQVDSSVGGKVAVNIPEGKNMVGSFYQPQLVIADTDYLTTLPKREWNAGMAEVVKYAAIGETELQTILNKQPLSAETMEQIIYLCCSCKAKYVQEDERDTGSRRMLNFGHSFGHAIEKLHHFKKYNHGEAVAIGMALAADFGTRLSVTEPETLSIITALMDNLGLNYTCSDFIGDIIPLMAGDKKNIGDEIVLVLLKKMGQPFIYRTTLHQITDVFKETDI